ncbi:MAG: hypothetical protein R6V85_11285 [Polyangia bacterium]
MSVARFARRVTIVAALLAALALLAAGCSPAVISRIGPPVPSRGESCGIEVLEPGEVPQRPYRDVGVVSLENCQDYRDPPCRGWLTEAACELGGHVTYVPDETPRDGGFGAMTCTVTVAAYVADLRPEPENDPVLGAERGELIPGCDSFENEGSDEPLPQRCVE